MTKFKLDFTNYDNVPSHTQGALARYVEDRLEPGGFLKAVLTNDLAGACARADSANRLKLAEIVAFIYNECPSGCWGSPEAYDNWLKGPERKAGDGGLDPSWLR